MSVSSPARSRPLLWVACALLSLHGLIEVLSLLLLLDPAHPGPAFIFDELAHNWQMTLGVGFSTGVLRLAAAGGVLANRAWGWHLGLILSAMTFAMLTFFLPAGVFDAILAGGALLCLVVGKYGRTPILG